MSKIGASFPPGQYLRQEGDKRPLKAGRGAGSSKACTSFWCCKDVCSMGWLDAACTSSQFRATSKLIPGLVSHLHLECTEYCQLTLSHVSGQDLVGMLWKRT